MDFWNNFHFGILLSYRLLHIVFGVGGSGGDGDECKFYIQ